MTARYRGPCRARVDQVGNHRNGVLDADIVRSTVQVVHRFLLELPWAGETIRKFTTAQMARTLSTLLGGGIPLVNAMEVTARSLSNRYMSTEMDLVTQRVREGQGLAASLAARNVVPDVALKMIEVGESTGSLQEMLNSLADFYDEEVETSVARFVTLIEPTLLVVMGVIVALYTAMGH